MSDLGSIGGGLGMVILGLGVLGLVVMLGLGGVALTRRRVPLAALVLVPVGICGVGAIGAWFSAYTSLAGLENAAADTLVESASLGAFEAIRTDWFSRWVAAFLFGVGAWAAGIGAFFAGPWPRWTPMSAVGAALLTLVGAGTISAFAGQYSLNVNVTPLIALLLFSGFGVAFAGLRRAMYEDAHRVAAMRFASAMCMLLAISYGSRALTQEVQMNAFGPGGIASEAESLSAAILMWGDVASPAFNISWIAFGFAILIAFAGFYYELGDVVERFTLVDVAITLVLLGGLGLLRTVEDWRVADLHAIETGAPAALVFDELSTDLPPSLLEIEDKSINVRPGVGGFGDVLQWDDEAETWTRTFRWADGQWSPDETPLDAVNDLSATRPLLVMTTGASGTPAVQVLEKSADGSALLLLRAEEVKAETTIPPELAYLQVTYLTLQLAPERKLDENIWAMAGERTARVGAANWFGFEEDDLPVIYTTAALTETEAPGMQIVADERTGIKDIIRTCLPVLFDLQEDEVSVEPSTQWCQFSTGTLDEVTKESMEAREAGAHDRFRASFGRVPSLPGRSIGAQHILDRLPYEFAAIDYCLGQAVDEGEELNGPLSIDLKFTRKGRVYASMNERSKNTNDMAVRCVRDRMKMVQFDVDEEIWPEPPSDRPAPDQILALTLDIRA